MSSNEKEKKPESRHPEGARWLKLLGREDLIGQPIPYNHPVDGHSLTAEEFPVLDRDAVVPIFTHIESLDPDDPIRAQKIKDTNDMLDYWLNQSPDGN
jgi:hypothetical protein